MRHAQIGHSVTIFSTMLAAQLLGEIIYVNVDANGADTGTDWTNAHCDLQTAIARSNPGDELWVAAGAYTPTATDDRTASFSPQGGTAIYGGFQGDESTRDERTPSANITVLSGNIGDPQTTMDNSIRVLQLVSVPQPVILDGIVIRDSYNDRHEEDGRGGGIYNVNSELQLIDCVVEDNYATGGGGLWNEDADPLLLRCTFQRNTNTAITNWSGGNPQLVECELTDNFAQTRGGAFNAPNFNHRSIFVACKFVGNQTVGLGGAYYGYGDPIFVDCQFIDNKAGDYAGVAYLHAGTARFTNCTIFRNRSGFLVGGIFTHSDDSTPIITNCLLWGNTAKRGSSLERYQLALHAGSVNYCCIEGWTGDLGGVGNFGDDPRFVDADKENLRLRDDSPCVDAGDDSVVTEFTDLDGNPRILGARVDIGCYESLCPAISALDLKCTNSGKLKATATTTLPEGSTVRFTQLDAQGRPKAHPATVKPTGKATAKWHPDSDEPVCLEGCAQPCAQATCR
ncbi:MAG: right-handed parallel beta-helix repeat-containing protein [Phycisphaerales bacterium]|nr:right-handed parallel beta-helix repeat-containing protein [Phycisphaerales bacterium]